MVKLPANVEGMPTEKTNAPKAKVGMSAHVMPGIVQGIPAGTTTHVINGIIMSACSHKEVPLDHKVKASATKHAEQEFGAVPFAKSAYGPRGK